VYIMKFGVRKTKGEQHKLSVSTIDSTGQLVYHRRFRTRVEAQVVIQEYIEVLYNRMRRHSALGNLAPAVFAENYHSERRFA
jgi:transposase InsO family protein